MRREQAVADALFPERCEQFLDHRVLSADERPQVVLPIRVKAQSPLVVKRLDRVVQDHQQQQETLVSDVGDAPIVGQDAPLPQSKRGWFAGRRESHRYLSSEAGRFGKCSLISRTPSSALMTSTVAPWKVLLGVEKVESGMAALVDPEALHSAFPRHYVLTPIRSARSSTTS
ncbi:MAG: hypothetical protein V5B40_20545 [Candidatus Accumulibacter meliphilus]|jgi:hypothetical protein|uniref:hypothetical protein n=1 Tax=Candidatus Accumulibacter meliphilus TaxID=2211374 RepID=UPI002FC314CE